MELLVIKVDNNYIKIKSGNYILCNIEDASVFPLSQIGVVNDTIENLKKQNFKNILIKKLVISEEPYN